MRKLFVLSVLALAACGEVTPERAAGAFQCQADATAQGLIPLTPERNAFMAACLSALATNQLINNLILDDDALGGGGKL